MTNPDTDKSKLMNVTLTHEFLRCTDALNLFAYLIATLPQNDTKRYRLSCFNAYVDFLSHLYEFYLPLIIRGIKFKQQGPYINYPAFEGKEKHEIVDIILTEEVQKLFRNRKDRIIKGYKDSLGHNVEFYECEIPQVFGKHFRFIRNRRNHADPKRASNDFDISLKDFFINYHKFVLIMHEECRWTAQVDESKFDWKAIDDFASEILK